MRRDQRAFSGGILASVLLHTLLILAWSGDLAIPERRAVDETPRVVPMTTFARVLPSREPAPPIRRPELPKPVLARSATSADLGKVTIPPTTLPPIPRVEVAPPREITAESAGEARGATRGPVPESILPNWRPPTAAIGMEVVARVLVTASGEAAGPVELIPPTPDHGFNRRIADRVMRLAYRPALRDGTPIADWAEISFVFCKTTVVATSPPAPNPRGRPCAPRDP